MTQTDAAADGFADRALDSVLASVPFCGWSREAIEEAARALDVPAADIDRVFPGGFRDMVARHSRRADRRMVEALALDAAQPVKVRDRVRRAIVARLEQNTAHKEAIRRALAVLALPTNAALGVTLLYETVDAIWRAAGDASTDFNFYTKRATLAGVYGATVLRWIEDRSVGDVDTLAFLDRRLEDVMRFERLKGRVREALARGPSRSSPSPRERRG
jgi:ubiquinone biosynthesis protein COQ9